MYSVDKILHAATVISSTLPRIEARNLVLHHRKELQFAFDSLGLALQSGSPRESSPSRPDRLAESLNALPSAQPQTQQPNTSYQTHHDHCQQTVNTYDHSRQNPEVLLSTHQQRPTHLLQSDSPDTRRRGSAEADTEQREANTEDHETNTEDHEANTEDTKAVLTLVEKLEKDHEKIKLFAGLSEEAAISRGNNWTTQEDPRYTDIQLATKTCSMSQRFRAWIAQYSFADDYLTWAETTSGEPRQSFFTLDAKNSKTKGKSQNKRVSHYLRAINKKTEVTRKSIQYGLKYHSFEYIYGNSGVSAFLFAVPTAFRLLSYPHLRLLADSISRSKVWSALAVDKRDWLCNCIAMYNQDCGKFCCILCISKLRLSQLNIGIEDVAKSDILFLNVLSKAGANVRIRLR
jgi:hypothetical protein